MFLATPTVPSAACTSSLLLGVGYDAYVVSGYAPATITRCDQTSSAVASARASAVAATADAAATRATCDEAAGASALFAGAAVMTATAAMLF